MNLYAIDCDGVYAGFIGLSSDTIEMLFVDSDCRGHGYGSALIDFARQRGATKVDVNQQNTFASGFYLAKGFRVISRDETDDAGLPYPILLMSL